MVMRTEGWGFFLSNFVYKTDMTVLHRNHNSLLGQMHLTSHIWDPWRCLLSSLSSCAGGSEAHLQLPVPIDHLHTPSMYRNHPNPVLNIFLADVHWAGSCKDGEHFLWGQESAFLALEARTDTCALPALQDCIYKLNERDNRCFHIISQGIEW